MKKAIKTVNSQQRKSAGGGFSYAEGGKVTKDPYDFSDRYNTQLTPAEEKEFVKWAGPKVKDLYDYDLKGFWKAGLGVDERGHGTDQFKKPNHPTFSNQSIYHGQNGQMGGVWGQTPEGQTVFTPSAHNLKNLPLPLLKRYFNEREPGALINIDPTTTEEANE